eukprot:12931939-Prorocentrum_lima.AAC.1
MLAHVSGNLSRRYVEQGGQSPKAMPRRSFKRGPFGQNHVANQGGTDIAPLVWWNPTFPRVRPVHKRQ